MENIARNGTTWDTKNVICKFNADQIHEYAESNVFFVGSNWNVERRFLNFYFYFIFLQFY